MCSMHVDVKHTEFSKNHKYIAINMLYITWYKGTVHVNFMIYITVTYGHITDSPTMHYLNDNTMHNLFCD